MRTINLRFATQLLLTFVGLGVGTFYLHRYQFERIAKDLFWQVNRASEVGKTNEAVAHAYRYLTFKPDDINVLVQVANWLEPSAVAKPQMNEVIRVLEQALRIDPDRADLRRRVIALDLKLRQYGDCLDHLERLLSEKPNDAELLCWLGQCRQATGRHSAAAQAYQKAIAADPKLLRSYFEYAELLDRYLSRSDDGRRILESAVTIDPTSAEAEAALARYLQRNGQANQAMAHVVKAVQLSPRDANVLGLAGGICQAAGDLHRARQFFEQAREIEPGTSRHTSTLAWLMICDGDMEGARHCLERYLKDHPNDADAIILFGEIVATEGKIDRGGVDSPSLQVPVQPLAGPNWMEKYLSARLEIRKGLLASAVQLLDELRIVTAKSPAMVAHVNYLRAQCFEQLSEYGKEVEAYRQLVDGDPASGVYRLQMCRALARAGQFEKAVIEFRTTIQSADLPASIVRSTTIEIVERCQHNRGKRALSDLERALAGIRGDDPCANAVLAHVEFLRLRNQNQSALKLANAFLDHQSKNIAMLALRARIIEAINGTAAALSVLKDAEERCGDQPEFRLTRLQLVPEPGTDLSPYARGLEQFPVTDRTAVLIELIAACGAVGNVDQMREAMSLLRHVRMDHPGVRAAMLTHALATNSAAEIDQLLLDLAGIEGQQGWTARRFAAERLIYADLTESEKSLNELGKERPNDPMIEFLRGRLNELQSRSSAIEHYRKALTLGLLDQPIEEQFWSLTGKENQPVAMLVEESGIIERLRLEQDRSVIAAVMQLAEPPLRHAVADRLLAANPEATAPQLLWLSRMFDRVGLPEQSNAAISAATKISPQITGRKP